jgi:hypothetical protein
MITLVTTLTLRLIDNKTIKVMTINENKHEASIM